MQATWDVVHAGEVVRGHDGNDWGVETIDQRGGLLGVTLVRHGQRITGWPTPDTPILVVQRCDTIAEAQAWQALAAAGLAPEVIHESWES